MYMILSINSIDKLIRLILISASLIRLISSRMAPEPLEPSNQPELNMEGFARLRSERAS